MLASALALLSALVATSPTPPGADPLQDPEIRLLSNGYLKPSERAALATGGVVAKVIDILDRSEVRTLVVSRTAASPADFQRCVRDPNCFRRAGEFLAAGTLSAPPSPRDFDRVTLDDKERRYLALCRVGNCDLRMSADDLERFRSGVDWTAPDQQARADELFRDMLLRYARSYIERGDGTLPVYADGKVPINGNESLQTVLRRESPLAEAAPELRRCLEAPPAAGCVGVERSLTWYKEKLWRETVVGLTDVAIFDHSTPGAAQIFVGSKQIFASNYYNASLEYAEYYRP